MWVTIVALMDSVRTVVPQGDASPTCRLKPTTTWTSTADRCVVRRAVVLPAPAAPSTTTRGPSAGQDTDHRGLGRVDPDQAAPADAGFAGWLGSAASDPGDEVSLSAEDLRRGQRPDVLGHIGSGEQPGAPLSGSGGDVLGELGPHRLVGEETGLGGEDLDLPADVGGVPRRPLRPQDRDHQLGRGVAVDPPRPRPRHRHRLGRVGVADLAQLVVPGATSLAVLESGSKFGCLCLLDVENIAHALPTRPASPEPGESTSIYRALTSN